ncbi:MAG: cytochrome c oxidase subunit 3 family protein [Planctomycetota bacterium]
MSNPAPTASPHSSDAHAHDAHDAHGQHAKYPFLAHHFETPAQQFDSGKLGMWVFLATEVLFFGALFVMYAILRFKDPQVFSYASQYLDTILGGVNTCVLILSSLTMAVGVRAAQTNKKGLLSICLALTLAGAIGFLVIKYFEYTHKFHENLKWGQAFYEPVNAADAAAVKVEQKPIENPVLAIASPNPSAGAVPVAMTALPPVDKSAILAPSAGPDGVATTAMVVASIEPAHIHHSGEAHLLDPALPPNTHRFFAIYYIMTGLHGIHVVIGVGVISWLLIGSLRGRYNSDYYAPVDFVGLYWHVVDLVWIFLFPLFYLIH